jgi:hypothetical protein
MPMCQNLRLPRRAFGCGQTRSGEQALGRATLLWRSPHNKARKLTMEMLIPPTTWPAMEKVVHID